MNITFKYLKKYSYGVFIDGTRVGQMTFQPADKNGSSFNGFRDLHTGIKGNRQGLTRGEYQDIIRRFYEASHGCIGYIEEYKGSFEIALQTHKIPYRNAGDEYYFFHSEEDLFAARMLV